MQGFYHGLTHSSKGQAGGGAKGVKDWGGDSPPYIQTCSAQYDDSPCTEYNVQFTASTTYETENVNVNSTSSSLMALGHLNAFKTSTHILQNSLICAPN